MNYCSVFIFRVGSLGDSIVALPAIKKLNNYYNDKFYLITNMPKNMIFPVWGCYKHTNYFKDYFEFEYSFKSFIKLRQFIRQKKGQKILYYFVDKSSFKRNFRNYLLFKILGFARIYGWKECIGDYIERDFNGKLETVQPEYERLGEIVDKCLEVEGTTNYSFDYIKFNDRSISSTLAKFSFIENNFLVLGVGGKTNIQRWDVYNYVEVLSALHNDIYVIILGGREEYKNANEIKEQLPNKQILNLCIWPSPRGKL